MYLFAVWYIFFWIFLGTLDLRNSPLKEDCDYLLRLFEATQTCNTPFIYIRTSEYKQKSMIEDIYRIHGKPEIWHIFCSKLNVWKLVYKSPVTCLGFKLHSEVVKTKKTVAFSAIANISMKQN